MCSGKISFNNVGSHSEETESIFIEDVDSISEALGDLTEDSSNFTEEVTGFTEEVGVFTEKMVQLHK
ncbi:unnamed protein product [Calypogeia fissa]